MGAELAGGRGEAEEVCSNEMGLGKRKSALLLIQPVFIERLLCVQRSRRHSNATSVRGKKKKKNR